jgi:hypothetical protein
MRKKYFFLASSSVQCQGKWHSHFKGFHLLSLVSSRFSERHCRFTAALAFHLSEVGLEKLDFSKKSEFLRTLLYNILKLPKFWQYLFYLNR